MNENKPEDQSITQRLRAIVIGGARSPHDRAIFHRLALIAFFAWVGLGADGLSSSCYGPQEAFLTLGNHIHLGIFVALGTAITIFVISAGYSQVIDVFPSGGGGYLVASKLLSPHLGMVSGSALIIDYVLTITVSVACGADAIFSFLPPHLLAYKVPFAVAGVLFLTLLNLRGVKESVLPLVPIFLVFFFTHVFTIIYAIASHWGGMSGVATDTLKDIGGARAELGLFGMIILILRAYSMGAGTYTGIEAVSNGLPILREPRVQTAKRTMRYMATSLAFVAVGLMIAYLLYHVSLQPGKTLNAVLFDNLTASWGYAPSRAFALVTLISEAAILFVAAQTGFLGGPRVIANMAQDRWLPTRLAMLSDRLVTENGILLMGIASAVIMIFTRGSVAILVILYSINVFITFVLSQLGMVLHWWRRRQKEAKWRKNILINGSGFALAAFILVSVSTIKFYEGGWITLLITGAVICLAILVKRHYNHTTRLLGRLDDLVMKAEAFPATVTVPRAERDAKIDAQFDPKAKTAVFFVNGFNGLGLHTLYNAIRLFGQVFKNFVFIQIGAIDAGNFKGNEEVDHLKEHVRNEVNRYIELMRRDGYYAEGHTSVAIDVVDEIAKIAPEILRRFPGAIFFGGQLVFERDSLWTRLLHNHIVFATQRRLYHQGIPLVILPIKVT
jgi:amino acid transporter